MVAQRSTCAYCVDVLFVVFFSSRRRHTRLQGDWSSDVCSSDLWISRPSSRPTKSWTSRPPLRRPPIRPDRCPKAALFLRRRDVRSRGVPVQQQNLEPPLFLSLVSLLVGPEIFDHALFGGIGRRRQGRVLD